MNLKKLLPVMLMLALLVLCIPAEAPAESGTDDGTAEWTVLFYLCGSDLESKHSYATGNLEEIMKSAPPFNMRAFLTGQTEGLSNENMWTDTDKVNVLIETGGCSEWHAGKLGMEIHTDRLERWRYDPLWENPETHETKGHFLPAGDAPLASMAEASTLTDFIRWGEKNYPAKKYALVLWDHGGGSKNGIFIDELFGGDRMYLEELGLALRESGVFFEAVVFDACMMANIETAWGIHDSARWMVASEEVVAGKGTAVGDWLNQLYYYPECTGDALGRWICDMTQSKYGKGDDEQSKSLLTMSVIDLLKIDDLKQSLEIYFAHIGEVYQQYPYLTCAYLRSIQRQEAYGSGSDHMVDIAGLFYDANFNDLLDPAIRKVLFGKLMQVVNYTVRGPGRNESKGLSFCYAVGFSNEELDIYCHNCPFASYLAFLDAINTGWEAPAWVYEKITHLPEIDTFNRYNLSVQKALTSDGLPGVIISQNYPVAEQVRYRLYRLNEGSGQAVMIGTGFTMPQAGSDDEVIDCVYRMTERPALEGMLCDTELIQDTEDSYLANIPIRIDTQIWNLRVGFENDEGYTVYGLWEGYDDNSTMFGRNVKTLAQFAGQQYQLLYPVYSEDSSEIRYEAGPLSTVYRAMEVRDVTIPKGRYYIEYVIEDVFGHCLMLDPVEVDWDGERLFIPEGTVWEGVIGEPNGNNQ